MKRILSIVFALAAALVLAGCATASGSSVVTGKARAATSAQNVKLYAELPPECEIIALVTASSNWALGKQKCCDYAVEELKNQAAKLGANGVVIESIGEKPAAPSASLIVAERQPSVEINLLVCSSCRHAFFAPSAKKATICC